MTTYGWKNPIRRGRWQHCPCCGEESSIEDRGRARRQMQRYAEFLIEEQLSTMPVNDCDAGTCDECNAMERELAVGP